MMRRYRVTLHDVHRSETSAKIDCRKVQRQNGIMLSTSGDDAAYHLRPETRQSVNLCTLNDEGTELN